MKENKGYNHYRNITNKVGKNNLRILSGRYRFLTDRYKYIYNDIFKKLEIKKSDDIFDIGTGDGKIIAFIKEK